MDNYILYEEIHTSSSKVIFKGRRRQSVLYVNIHRFDTALKDYATVNVHSLHSLKHRNVLQFLEWYQSSKHVWVVTELADGGTLSDIMDQDGPLSGGTACSIIKDLAAGLHYVHSQGIVVCDLVPSKILIDCNGDLKISDFTLCWNPGTGIARWSLENIKKSFEVMEHKISEIKQGSEDDNDVVICPHHLGLRGLPSPFYMAPEVARDVSFSVQSDLWSMGCILMELITGLSPYYGEMAEYEHITAAASQLDVANVTDDQHAKDLLSGLLNDNTENRLTWNSVQLQHLLTTDTDL